MEYAPTADTTERHYEAVTTAEQLDALVRTLGDVPRFALRVLPEGPPRFEPGDIDRLKFREAPAADDREMADPR